MCCFCVVFLAYHLWKYQLELSDSCTIQICIQFAFCSVSFSAMLVFFLFSDLQLNFTCGLILTRTSICFFLHFLRISIWSSSNASSLCLFSFQNFTFASSLHNFQIFYKYFSFFGIYFRNNIHLH